jgi:hypothetical protein
VDNIDFLTLALAYAQAFAKMREAYYASCRGRAKESIKLYDEAVEKLAAIPPDVIVKLEQHIKDLKREGE